MFLFCSHMSLASTTPFRTLFRKIIKICTISHLEKSAAPNAIFVIRKRGSGRWINKLGCVRFLKGPDGVFLISTDTKELLSQKFKQFRNFFDTVSSFGIKLKLYSAGNKRDIMATDRKSSNKGSCLQPSKFNTVTFSLPVSFLSHSPKFNKHKFRKGEEQQL